MNTKHSPSRRHPVLTAREFIAQGTTAGAIMSIAKGRTDVEAVARTVASLTGQPLKWPGQVAAENMRRRPVNDNRGAERKVV